MNPQLLPAGVVGLSVTLFIPMARVFIDELFCALKAMLAVVMGRVHMAGLLSKT